MAMRSVESLKKTIASNHLDLNCLENLNTLAKPIQQRLNHLSCKQGTWIPIISHKLASRIVSTGKLTNLNTAPPVGLILQHSSLNQS